MQVFITEKPLTIWQTQWDQTWSSWKYFKTVKFRTCDGSWRTKSIWRFISLSHRHKNTHIQTHTPSHHSLTVIPESEKVLENKINWPIHTKGQSTLDNLTGEKSFGAKWRKPWNSLGVKTMYYTLAKWKKIWEKFSTQKT